MDPGAQWRPPSISAPGYGKNATPMATLGSGNAPSSLARRLAAGHADKDAHDADEWRKWRRDRILAAIETVGVRPRGSPLAACYRWQRKLPGDRDGPGPPLTLDRY